MPQNQQALPNGSGVSFGLAVLAESLGAYRRACTFSAKAKPGAPAPPSLPPAVFDLATFKDLEAAMTKQLRVTTDELRAFMRDLPEWIGDAVLDAGDQEKVESFLVESSFAFTSAQTLAVHAHRPEKLFELPPVKSLVDQNLRTTELRLQALRLRFRVRTDDDNSRSRLSLGWNPEPWGEGATPWGVGKVDGDAPWYVRLTGVDPSLPDWLRMPALALELGINVERVRRVGTEGIVELHQMVVPRPYDSSPAPQGYGLELAQKLDDRNRRANAELLVPPVVLFSQ
jgi:hypothetical protein